MGKRGKRQRQTRHEEDSVVKRQIQSKELTFEPVYTLSRVTEKEAGLCVFLTNTAPFRADLKCRFSDFQVSEVGEDGVVAQLNNHVQKCELHETVDKPSDAVDPFKEMEGILNQIDIDELHSFIESEYDRDRKTIVLETHIAEKEDRKQFHAWVRQHFAGFATETNAESKLVVNRGQVKGMDRRDPRWASGNPQYLKFVLYKENIDTMFALSTLARSLRLGNKVFEYAGTKDKRGITSQWVTGYHVSHESLQKAVLNHGLNEKGIYVGNMSYSHTPLKLGHLWGNRFRLILRNAAVDTASTQNLQSLTATAMQQIKERGFINYFGMQRFGTATVGTYQLGMAVIKDDLEEFFRLLLAPRSNPDTDFKGDGVVAGRQLVVQGDFEQASTTFPRFLVAERASCAGLARFGTNQLEQVIMRIPRGLRLMYLHSYQSYLYNHMATVRTTAFPIDKCVPGDLVIRKGLADEVCIIDESNAEDYTMEDVVLPLIGYDSILPANAVGEKARELLQADGIKQSMFNHRVKEFSLSGTYRSVLVKPEQVEWSLIPYSDETEPLLQSDRDLLEGDQMATHHEGALTAIRVEFNLPASSYASMFYRELTKQSSTFDHTVKDA